MSARQQYAEKSKIRVFQTDFKTLNPLSSVSFSAVQKHKTAVGQVLWFKLIFGLTFCKPVLVLHFIVSI